MIISWKIKQKNQEKVRANKEQYALKILEELEEWQA